MPENQDPKTEEPKTEDFDTKLNQAITSHMKRLDAKYAAEFKKLTDIVTAPKEEPAKEESKSSNPELAELLKKLDNQERAIKELKAKEKASLQQARVATTRNELSELVKGKVLPDWQDIAIDRLMSKVNLEGEKPEYDLGEYPGSLADGIEAFTKDPANKRFLPPVAKAAVRTAQTYTPPIANREGAQQPFNQADANSRIEARLAVLKQ